MKRTRLRRTDRLRRAGSPPAALLVTACGGGGSSGQGTGQSAAAAEFNAGLTAPVNPSETKGGTLKFANSGRLGHPRSG